MILREIIIGARGTITQEEIAQIVISRFTRVEIIKSRLAFKTYRVVQNKMFDVLEI